MKQKGFTLIEILISLVVLGILLASVLGTAQTIIANSRLRGVAEEFRTGLMTAKIEAIKRNSAITFTPDTVGGWEIAIPKDYLPADITPQTEAFKLHTKVAGSTSITVTPSTTATVITFTGSGRPDSEILYSFKPTNGTCPSNDPTSDQTCLNVLVTSGGQIQVCNPNAAAPYGCP